MLRNERALIIISIFIIDLISLVTLSFSLYNKVILAWSIIDTNKSMSIDILPKHENKKDPLLIYFY
jgi:hypothetical protein